MTFAGCDTWAARDFLARTCPGEPLPPHCGHTDDLCPPITSTKEPTP